MWGNWLSKLITLVNMEPKSDQIQFHASSTGRLYLIDSELFNSTRFRELIEKLKKSSLYKEIKKKGKTGKWQMLGRHGF